MSTTDGDAPASSGREVLRLLLSWLAPHRGWCALILLAMLGQLAFEILLSLCYGHIFDEVIPRADLARLGQVAAVLGLAFGVAFAAAAGRAYGLAHVSSAASFTLGTRLFARLHAGSRDPGPSREAGDLLAHFVHDLAAIELSLAKWLPNAVQGSLLIAGGLLAVAVLEWRLAAVALVAGPLALLTSLHLGARTGRASRVQKDEQARLATLVEESLAARPVVEAFGLEADAAARYAVAADRLRRASRRVGLLGQLAAVTAEYGVSLLVAAMIVMSAVLCVWGYLSVGTLVASCVILLSVGYGVEMVANGLAEIRKASGSVERVQHLLQRPLPATPAGARPAPPLTEGIRLEGACLAYGNQRAVHALDLHLPAGNFLALVGPSGAGKSSVLRLLVGSERCTRGTVSWDGRELTTLTPASLRAQVGAVFQEAFLFDASIAENIRLGRPGAGQDEVEAAARAAEIHEAVVALPEGYRTRVGPRGEALSGGQRQRLALARALIREPRLLLLDEPTSSLDPETEAKVVQTLRRLARGRTMVLATHRLTTVRHADRIVVLDGGRLVEQGSHPELLARGGLYARLHAEQPEEPRPAERAPR